MLIAMLNSKINIPFYRSAILNSYSQVFFSTHRLLSIILLIVSFLDYTAGLCGLLSVLVGVVLTKAIGVDQFSIEKGLYGFNNLLVGLGLGLYFQWSIELIMIVVMASLLTTFISFAIQGVIGKYALPYLSIPFLFGIWLALLATRDFSALGLSAKGIYTINEVYAFGGSSLLSIYQTIDVYMPLIINTYLKSLGAIFFQYNMFAGILIVIGLLIYSRIIFSLTVIGYFSALAIYHFFGIEISTLSYSYIGFNYILTSIAIGGYYLIPSRYSYGILLIILPITILLSFATERILLAFSLPAYSLPFNLMVLLFIYTLRFRTHRPKYLREVIVQQESPEKNVYIQQNEVNKMRSSGVIPIGLPVMGKWTINQAYNGEYTHQGEWRHAFDLVIKDDENKEFFSDGLELDHYFCYRKNVSAPADGYVMDIIDGIEDNLVGNVDIKHNWGNSIVIQHVVGLNSQFSHLLKGSLLVKKGDFVQKGQVIAKVGNSGRSPYPHLHFQMQIAPYIGSKTLAYPLSNYIISNKKEDKFHSYGTPKKDKIIQNVIPTPILSEAFNFSPGQELEYEISDFDPSCKKHNIPSKSKFVVHSDIYNNTYLECQETGAKAWFYYDTQLFHFANYQGSKDSFLYYFMLALFKVEMAYSSQIIISDVIPTHLIFKKNKLWWQDFLAPFYVYLKGNYQLKHITIDDDMTPQEVHLGSSIQNLAWKKLKDAYTFDIQLSYTGIDQIKAQYNGKNLFTAKCINNQKI